MIKILGHDYDVIDNGVCYGYLPKIGDNGLLIINKLYDGKWRFALSGKVKNWMDNEPIWFQTWNGKDYEWFHGVMDATGKITQIG